MNCFSKYFRLPVALFTLLIYNLNISGQTDLNKSVTNDTLSGSGDSPKHSLYAAAGYGSNMVYLGSSISNNLPFYSAAISYGFRNSLYISASATHLAATQPWLAFINLSANYSHTFNSWFDISADVAGYVTHKNLQDSLFSNFGFLGLTTGFDWKILYTRVSVNGILSDGIKGYILVTNSRYFQTPEFFGGKAFLSFNPDFSILSGEIIKIETITGVKKYGLSPPFRHFKKNSIIPTDSYKSQFGLIDFEFSLPVTLNFRTISIEAEPSYILPAYKNSEYPAPEGFSFYLSVFVKIF
ncbi:MAG: hypothetical protein LLG13_03985 [Bacteroidales bacterium]|nr:hypothetical protein [Bacteroidales bacterium]